MSTHLAITTSNSIEAGVNLVADLGLIEQHDFSNVTEIYRRYSFCEYDAVEEYFEGNEVPNLVRVANIRNIFKAKPSSVEKHIEEVLFKLPEDDVLSGCTIIGFSGAVKIMQKAVYNVCQRLGIYLNTTTIDFGPEPTENAKSKPAKKAKSKPAKNAKSKHSKIVEELALALGLESEEDKLSLSALIDMKVKQITSDNYVPFKYMHNIDKVQEVADADSLKTEASVEEGILLQMLVTDINNINNINVDIIDKLIIMKTCLKFLSKSSEDEYKKMLKALKKLDINLALSATNFEKYNSMSILEIPKAELDAARLATAAVVRIETIYGMSSYLKAI